MHDLFYDAFKWAHRPGRTLDVLARPFPDVQPYAERITDTLQVARSTGDLAQGKTICTLCDLALTLLPMEHAAASILCRRALKNVRRETRHYLAAYGHENGQPKGEYDARDRNAPPTLHPDVKTFIETQGKLPPKKK